MENEPVHDHEHWFREDEDWIAALARQLFRARRAGDAEAVEGGLLLARGRVPQLHRFVIAAAGQRLAVRAPGQGLHAGRVPREGGLLLPRAHVPELDRAV